MTQSAARNASNAEESAVSGMLTPADMVTLNVQLVVPAHTLMLAMPKPEWLKLVSDFVKMPADERQRVGVSIRDACTNDPFPTDGAALSPKQQRVCDIFVNDCILLAALAEAVGGRILLDTAVEAYKVVPGLPQLGHVKGSFN